MSPSEIKEARKTLGKTQKQFADLLGVSHRSVQSWEKGIRNVSASVSFHINSILKQHKNYSTFPYSVPNKTGEDHVSYKSNVFVNLYDTIKKLKGTSQHPEWDTLESQIEDILQEYTIKDIKIEQFRTLVDSMKQVLE